MCCSCSTIIKYDDIKIILAVIHVNKNKFQKLINRPEIELQHEHSPLSLFLK